MKKVINYLNLHGLVRH